MLVKAVYLETKNVFASTILPVLRAISVPLRASTVASRSRASVKEPVLQIRNAAQTLFAPVFPRGNASSLAPMEWVNYAVVMPSVHPVYAGQMGSVSATKIGIARRGCAIRVSLEKTSVWNAQATLTAQWTHFAQRTPVPRDILLEPPARTIQNAFPTCADRQDSASAQVIQIVDLS